MNSTFVEAWDAFNVSTRNIIRYRFEKNLLPHSITNLNINSPSCVAYVQVSSVAKAKDINSKVHRTILTIKIEETRKYDPVVVLLANIVQQPYRNLFLSYAVYDTVGQRTIIPLQ